MENWQLCPKCCGNKTICVPVYGGCNCDICNGCGIISSFTGKPPEWSYQEIETSDSTTVIKPNKQP